MRPCGDRLADLTADCMRLAADCYRCDVAGKADIAIECARRLRKRADEVLEELGVGPDERLGA